MKPGRELDTLVMEHVFGLEKREHLGRFYWRNPEIGSYHWYIKNQQDWRGIMPGLGFEFVIIPRFSTCMGCCMYITKNLGRSWKLEKQSPKRYIVKVQTRRKTLGEFKGKTAAHALCIAAVESAKSAY